MKRITVIFTQSTWSSACGREGQDMILALAAVEHQVTVVYQGLAVLQLKPLVSNLGSGCKDFTPMQKLFALYDIEHIYVCAESLQKYGIAEADIRLPVTLLNTAKLNEVFSQQDIVLRF